MQRPQSHEIGDSAEALFQAHLVTHGWVVNKLTPDYGFDFLVQPTLDRELEGAFALVQVKALPDREISESLTLRVSASHAKYWQAVAIPTFIAAVDLRQRAIYARACLSTIPLDIDSIQTFSVSFLEQHELTPHRLTAWAELITDFWFQERERLLQRILGSGGAFRLDIRGLTKGMLAEAALDALRSLTAVTRGNDRLFS